MPINSWAGESQEVAPLKQENDASVPVAPVVEDVALMSGDVLEGRVVDEQGKPLAGSPVSLRQQQNEIATVKTDQSGVFRVSGVRGGVYRLVSLQDDGAPQGEGTYRAWPQGTAPPSARPRLTFVQYPRGGPSRGPIISFLRSPLGIITTGCLIATAIAVPIAVANRDKGSSS